jgi:hypothetical protein
VLPLCPAFTHNARCRVAASQICRDGRIACCIAIQLHTVDCPQVVKICLELANDRQLHSVRQGTQAQHKVCTTASTLEQCCMVKRMFSTNVVEGHQHASMATNKCNTSE